MTSTLDERSASRASSGVLALSMIGVSLGMLLSVLDQTIVATALPRIGADLGRFDGVSWVVTAYLLTSTATTPLYGKLGDLYGRKPLYLISVSVFVLASALAGLSQSLTQLIALRALQGLGGGGLTALAVAIIGDLVPARERGRYEGYIGGVFALGSIGGPLTGGFFTDHLSWRWVFYINVPFGLLALVITVFVLKLPRTGIRAKVDYLGSALLVGAVTCLLLITVWGGRTYAWSSVQILSLGASTVVLLAAFLAWEHRVTHPVLPLRLFRNGIFTLAIAASVMVGVSLFGSVVFLPQFFQIVRGMSPTASGLALTPLMLMAIVTAVIAGRQTSKTGTYKRFPIIGAILIAAGFLLLTQLEQGTSDWLLVLYMVVLGLGIGFVMQVLVLAAQNAVAYEDMGTATSTATFSRTLGGAIGTAVFGTILVRRVDHELAQLLPSAGHSGTASRLLGHGLLDPARIPAPLHEALVTAFARSLHTVFAWALPFAAALLVLSLLIPERPLQKELTNLPPE